MKSKPRTSVEIIAEIQTLLVELASSSNGSVTRAITAPRSAGRFSGPSGGIRLLLQEKFFATPKTRVEVISRLKQEGFNYRPGVVSVALLRHVRARELVRLPSTGEGKEKWVFAERK